MNKSGIYSLVGACLLIALSVLTGEAQNRMVAQKTNIEQTEQVKRPSLLRELNLTPAQLRQIRPQIQSLRAQQQAAKLRLKEANEELDRALYANADNDDEVQARLRDVHTAQLEVLKNRVAQEQAIKRVLMPEQLDRFRELRQQSKINQPPNIGNGLNKPTNENLPPRQQLRLKRLANRQQRRLNQ